MSKNRVLIFSISFAFILSLFTVLLVFPESNKLIYTDINQPINISLNLLLKIIVVLLGQTSLLGSVFYVIAKKMFIK